MPLIESAGVGPIQIVHELAKSWAVSAMLDVAVVGHQGPADDRNLVFQGVISHQIGKEDTVVIIGKDAEPSGPPIHDVEIGLRQVRPRDITESCG